MQNNVMKCKKQITNHSFFIELYVFFSDFKYYLRIVTAILFLFILEIKVFNVLYDLWDF